MIAPSPGEFAFRLFRTAVHLVRLERVLSSRGALRLPKLTALAAIEADGEVQTELLAQRESVSQPTMINTITVLARRRLVWRQRSTLQRARGRGVRLTAKGRAQLDAEKRRLSALTEQLSPQELHILEEAVAILEREALRLQQRDRQERLRARARAGLPSAEDQ